MWILEELDEPGVVVRLRWEVVGEQFDVDKRFGRELGEAMPCERTVRRYIQRTFTAAQDVYERQGPKTFRNTQQEPILRDLSSIGCGEVLVGDHREFDLEVINPARGGELERPWITCWFDLGSRCPAGWVISFSPDSRAIAEAFAVAVGPKTEPLLANVCGLPNVVHQDNGKDYRASALLHLYAETGVEVRQALDMAIDKAAIVRTIYGDAGTLARSFVPAANWAHDDSLKPVPYDPAKARAMLQKAGVLPLNLTLWAMPVVRNYNPNGQLMAQMIQADWAKVGVTARIVTYEWGEYLRRIDAGEHDTALSGWNSDPEPANTFGQLACGAVGNFWCSPAYDKLLVEARQTLKQDERRALYAKAQRIVMQELPWSPIAHGRLALPARATVKGLVLELDGGMFFDGVLPK